jgi:hypothetical protein
MDDDVTMLLAEQIADYRAHAPDYDIVYLDKAWDRSIDELPITGDVLSWRAAPDVRPGSTRLVYSPNLEAGASAEWKLT